MTENSSVIVATEKPRQGRGEGKLSPRRVSAARKQAEAMRLRASGESFAAIAESLGYKSASGAWQAIQAGLKHSRRETGDLLRELEHQRLDALAAPLWPLALKGDLKAAALILDIERERIQLEGLRRPIQIAPVTPEGGPLELNLEHRILDAMAVLRALIDLAGDGEGRGTEEAVFPVPVAELLAEGRAALQALRAAEREDGSPG